MKSREKEPDEQLLIEASQRDPSRFVDLYQEHFDRVYAYIARRVRDRSEAQDLTSDVFHQALANIARFEWRGAPFASWLFSIASNAVADHYQRIARERGTPRADNPEKVGPDSGLEEVERRARLFKLVDRLPTDQRRVVLMRFAEEKSIREIAQDLGRSEGAIKQLQYRALQSLRARMRDANG